MRVRSPPDSNDMDCASCRGLGEDVDPRLERIDPLLEDDVGLSAAEEAPEDLAEMLANRRERLVEFVEAALIELADRLLEAFLGLLEIGSLAIEAR